MRKKGKGTKNLACQTPTLIEKEVPAPEDSSRLFGWRSPWWRKNVFQALLAEGPFIKKT